MTWLHRKGLHTICIAHHGLGILSPHLALKRGNASSLQDFQHFPKVDRNIQQLQHFADSLRAKTNKFRSLNNQIAASRLLAQQGFDATRCVVRTNFRAKAYHIAALYSAS
eukprot:366093-Chlamydomonas_euryale.AAC.8